VTASGVARQFDYYGAFGRVDSRNNLPNDSFHNATYTGNFGWDPNPANDLRFTVRHLSFSAGQPNGILLYGIPDDAAQKAQEHLLQRRMEQPATTKWHNEIRYGGCVCARSSMILHRQVFPDPALTGNFLGAPITITGSEWFSVTGQAIFQFAAISIRLNLPPSPTVTLSTHKRTIASLRTSWRSAASNMKAERGSTQSSGFPASSISRGNYSYTLQISGDIRNRLYYNVGSGIEDNGLFGLAGTPRASVAYYLARPSGSGWLTGTKLHASSAKALKSRTSFNRGVHCSIFFQQFRAATN